MNNLKTKKLVQGAMIAGLFGVIALVNIYTGGFFDIFFCYGIVSPLAWYGYHYTLKDNFIVVFASMVVVLMVSSPFFVISTLSACISGVFIGEALKRKAGKGVLFLGEFIVNLLNNLMIYEVFAGVIGISLESEMAAIYNEVSAFVPYLTLDKVLSLAPIMIVVTSLLEMYVIVVLTQLILRRLKVNFPGSFHIANMHLSKGIGILLLIVLIVSFVAQSILRVDHYLVMYVYLISYLILMVQGLSFISYVLVIKNEYKYIFLAFLGVFVIHVIYVFIGIYDIFSDLRKNILYNESDVNKEEMI